MLKPDFIHNDYAIFLDKKILIDTHDMTSWPIKVVDTKIYCASNGYDNTFTEMTNDMQDAYLRYIDEQFEEIVL